MLEKSGKLYNSSVEEKELRGLTSTGVSVRGFGRPNLFMFCVKI